MVSQGLDLKQAYTIGPSNGTTLVSYFSLGEGDNFIAIENIAMFGGEFFLRDAPMHIQRVDVSVRPEVSAILERSLKEHAATWAELAKR
jgi:hypothetical protein